MICSCFRRGVGRPADLLTGYLSFLELLLFFAFVTCDQCLDVSGYRRRLFKAFLWFAFPENVHERIEVWKCPMTTCHIASQIFFLFRIAHPHARYPRGRVTDEPYVGVIVNRSRFSGERLTRRAGTGGRATRS